MPAAHSNLKLQFPLQAVIPVSDLGGLVQFFATVSLFYLVFFSLFIYQKHQDVADLIGILNLLLLNMLPCDEPKRTFPKVPQGNVTGTLPVLAHHTTWERYRQNASVLQVPQCFCQEPSNKSIHLEKVIIFSGGKKPTSRCKSFKCQINSTTF